jgi:hypothetical protein
MHRSLRALLTEVVDYAGLFRPTWLPVEQAVRNYARHRAEPEAWMLARLLCPAARLGELASSGAELFSPDEPCRLSLSGAENPLAAEAIKDVRVMEEFLQACGDWAAIEVLEACLPPEASGEWRPEAVSEALNVLATCLVAHHFSEIEVFLEPTFTSDWNETVRRVVAALRLHDEQRGQPAPARIGLKLPAGAIEGGVFPSVEQLAFAIVGCRDARIPLKFSAGPHHPFGDFDVARRTKTPGFVNVLVAGVLAHARGLEEATVRELLEERDPHAFDFTEDGFRWRALEADLGEINTARDELVLSFGSCSFDEPRQGLRQLNLL